MLCSEVTRGLELISSLVVVCVCAGIPSRAEGSCEKLAPCKWKCSTSHGEGVIDLTGIGEQGRIRFDEVAAPDTYKYSYNPCYPFDKSDHQAQVDECKKQDQVVVCQHTETSLLQSWFYNAGSQNTEKFSVTGDVVQVTYAGSGKRLSTVGLICGSGSPSLRALGEQGTKTGQYHFELTTNQACIGSSSLSGGSILLLIFFPLLIAYAVGGVAYNIFYRKTSGRNAVPNVDFWTALPSYISSGFIYTGKLLKIPYCAQKTYEAI